MALTTSDYAALYLVEWIFTLFAKSLPLEPVAWLWDRVLV